MFRTIWLEGGGGGADDTVMMMRKCKGVLSSSETGLNEQNSAGSSHIFVMYFTRLFEFPQ